MMNIIVAKTAGFCFGVKRAVELALKTSENHKHKKIYTLGPIIHNNDVVLKLKKDGINVLDYKDIDKIKESVVILRSHGVEKNIYEKIKENKNIIIDAICPFVKKIHKYVDTLTREGYFVVIIGDKEHPEVKAIYSFAQRDKSIIVSNSNDKNLKEIFSKRIRKIGVVVQTTQDIKEFKKICDKLIQKKGEIRIFNSICDSTAIRQKESKEIAGKVDLMLILGGKHSANTKRLYKICKEINEKIYHIENAKELQKEWFNDVKVVGITAGASTPDFVINEVIEKINSFAK